MCLIKTIKLNELERYYITNILKEDKIVILSENGFGKKVDLNEFPLQGRVRKRNLYI